MAIQVLALSFTMLWRRQWLWNASAIIDNCSGSAVVKDIASPSEPGESAIFSFKRPGAVERPGDGLLYPADDNFATDCDAAFGFL